MLQRLIEGGFAAAGFAVAAAYNGIQIHRHHKNAGQVAAIMRDNGSLAEVAGITGDLPQPLQKFESELLQAQ